MRTFVCQSCQAVTRRIEGALALAVCPFCRGSQVTELNPAKPAGLSNAVFDSAVLDGAVLDGAVLDGAVLDGAVAEPAEDSASYDDESDERPCDRGEPCARLSGKDCPGGRGC